MTGAGRSRGRDVPTGILRWEAGIRMAINAAISAGFFFAVSGMTAPIAARTFGMDFLPQAFMGSLVPGLVRKHRGAPAGWVMWRSLLFAVAALEVADGAALVVCLAMGDAFIAPLPGVIIKIVFGTLLAGVATPVAVRAALHMEHRT